MRFSENGYYIESYVKCDNCGVLIYGDPIPHSDGGPAEQGFCTQWCFSVVHRNHCRCGIAAYRYGL